ncbi:MAG: hypothetical protein R3Y11_08445 [Pseudomonadota bacterium]
MCFNACPYFNRYTEMSSCRCNEEGLLPCEIEEADEVDDDEEDEEVDIRE